MITLELTPPAILPALQGCTFRPARLEDLPALHALLVAAVTADGRDRVDSLADLQTQFDDPWSNPETDSLLGFTSGGQLAAFARAFVHPEPEREVCAHLWLEVHPDHRAPELIDATLNWLEARGLERLLNSPAHLPRSLRFGVQDDVAWHITLLEQRGFQPVRYFYRMRRDLSQPIPEGPLPPGFSFSRYSPELDGAMLAVFNESFRDHWGFETVIREDWEKFFIGRASFRPDLSLLVFDNSGNSPEAAGFSFNTVDREENARLGIKEGWVGDLGVRRPWRRRGLATALLCESMRLFKAEGLDYATLGVDTENPTGALGVYERVGFAPVRRMVAFDKPLKSVI